MKIGFLDSGLGGLIILKAVAKELPQYDYEYYGDTKHLPYGDKTEDEIFTLTKAGVIHLFERDCALVIIACNTASAESLRKLQDSILIGKYQDRRILGVIIPTVEVVYETGINSVALIATKRTVDSKKYEIEFAKFDPNLKVHSTALPTLVPLIESGLETEAFAVIKKYLTENVEQKLNVLILGCTHYSLLKTLIRDYLGSGVDVVSQDELIPLKLKNYLERHLEISALLSTGATRNIFLTDSTKTYDKIISHLLGGTFLSE